MSTVLESSQEAISTNQLCTMLGLSKRRFLELRQRGVFPQPTAYAVQSRRPIYSPEIVQRCLEVRWRNVGINDEIVFFHVRSAGPVSRRSATTRPRRTASTRTASGSPQAAGILDALAQLLGHESIQTSARYSQRTENQLSELVKRVVY
jgi:hypothetical protein